MFLLTEFAHFKWVFRDGSANLLFFFYRRVNRKLNNYIVKLLNTTGSQYNIILNSQTDCSFWSQHLLDGKTICTEPFAFYNFRSLSCYNQLTVVVHYQRKKKLNFKLRLRDVFQSILIKKMIIQYKFAWNIICCKNFYFVSESVHLKYVSEIFFTIWQLDVYILFCIYAVCLRIQYTCGLLWSSPQNVPRLVNAFDSRVHFLLHVIVLKILNYLCIYYIMVQRTHILHNITYVCTYTHKNTYDYYCRVHRHFNRKKLTEKTRM